MKKILTLFVITAMLFSLGLTSIVFAENDSAVFYVAPNGSDSNDGSQNSPFATIEGAKNAIKSLKNSGGLPNGGITVYIRGGTYNVSKEILFTNEDSGTEQCPITYKAYENEKPVFSGGVTIDGSKFAKVTDETVLNRIIDTNAKQNIYGVSLEEYNISDYGYEEGLKRWGVCGTSALAPVEVFVDDTALDMARYPNRDENGKTKYLFTGEVISNPHSSDNTNNSGKPVFKYDDERIEKWSSVKNTAVHGLFPNPYFFEGHSINSVDKDNNQITLTSGGYYGITKGNRYYYMNVLEELDNENEYYIDTEKNMLYIYAPNGLNGKNVSLSVMGKNFYESMFHFKKASYITLDGLEITLTRTHGVWIDGGNSIKLENCTIKNIGLRAVTVGSLDTSGSDRNYYVRGYRATDTQPITREKYLEYAGYNHGVENCQIYNCGAGGVRFYGGDRVELEPCGYYLKNSVIHDVDRFATTYGYAVDMMGVGITVSHNTIYNTQMCAIQTACNDSVIEYNELYNCLTEGADMGIIYNTAWNAELETGLEIRYNYCHDTENEIYSGEHDWAGDTVYRCFVYKDDGNSFQEVHHNLVVNVPRGVNNVGGSEVNWNNNVFVDVLKPINLGYQPQRQKALNAGTDIFASHGSKEFKVFADLPAWKEKHPEVKKMMDLLTVRGNKAYYEQKEIMNNLIVYMDKADKYTESFSWGSWASDYCVIYNNKFFKTNPGFKDFENKNYEIQNNQTGIDLSWLKMDMFGSTLVKKIN